MNVIDLISETHTRLRSRVNKRWEELGYESISQSETHLLSRVSMKSLTISEAARQTAVSRQATQKTAAKLIDKGYLIFRRHNENKRDKYLYLTPKARDYIELSDNLKKMMEEEIMARVGKELIMDLKELLIRL